jgi:NAD(P)-dependent dehydrogenase (short-subunit alcohol dehydrogenase family)
MKTVTKLDWALILGASSGFGAASALALAREGMNIFGVHLDRRPALPRVEALEQQIAAAGANCQFFNINAASDEKREETLDQIARRLRDSGQRLRVLLHSLAFGSLKPFVSGDPAEFVDVRSLDMTVNVMAHSLVYWCQGLVRRELLGPGGRILAMTSAGSQLVLPAYGPVSAAKGALETHCRQLAVELAPLGVTVNALMAGVTDTPALRKIPDWEAMMQKAQARNPSRRLTRVEDVASAIALLCRPESQWITGNVIRVDGGEGIAG